MNNRYLTKPLGAILQQAGLVSEAQIEVALRDQSSHTNLRLGEILALRGWIKSETVDFFADKLPKLLNQKKKRPLGQYLKEAALLNESQIATILKLQKQTGLRFGALAVRNGWLKQSTVDFLIGCLVFQSKCDSESLRNLSASKLGEYFDNARPEKRTLLKEEIKSAVPKNERSFKQTKITLETTPLSRETELIVVENIETSSLSRSSFKSSRSYQPKVQVKAMMDSNDYEDIPWID